MKLSSSDFTQGGTIPRKFTCQGIDVNPSLQIEDVPPGTKSLVLIMDDPDVPKNVRKDGWWIHWVAYNIPPNTRIIPEAVPSLGTFGKNTGGMNRYMGPCPPDREHRYYFRLYALDTLLSLQEGATKEELLKAMQGHILDQCELMGRYNKE